MRWVGRPAGAARTAMLARARGLRAAWGCDRADADRPPLPKHLAALERAGCAKLGTAPQGTCPLRPAYWPDAHARELLDARAGVGDEVRLTWPEALGRPLVAADRPKLLALGRAVAHRQRLDDEWRRAYPQGAPDEPEED